MAGFFLLQPFVKFGVPVVVDPIFNWKSIKKARYTTECTRPFTFYLPDPDAVFRLHVQGITLFNAKGLVPGVMVTWRQRAVTAG